MDSARRALRLCVVAIAVLVNACSFHFTTNGIAATQATVEQTIDEKLPTYYHGAAPDLPLGRAHRPGGFMELDHGKVGHCTFELGQLSIPIVVTLDSKNQIQYKTDGVLIDALRLESYIQSNLLQSYAIHVRVACGNPRYRLLRPGARVSCRLIGDQLPKSVTVQILDDGRVFINNPPGLKSRAEVLTRPLIEKHKASQKVIVSGKIIENIFNASLLPTLQAESAKQHLRTGAISCPPSVDLSGSKRASCRLNVSGKDIRLAFWIKGDDWHMATLDVVFSRISMEAAATRYYRQLERDNGFAVKVTVHCDWPDVIVLTPPASRDCNMTVDKDKRRLTIQFPTANGSLNYYVWPKSDG